MRKKFFGLFILLIFYGINVSALQNKPFIQGKVTDNEGQPLVGATVAVENTFIGTTTGVDGSYAIFGLSRGSYTITYSFIGYESVTLNVGWQENLTKNVSLSIKEYMAGEVIVVATRAGSFSPLAFSNVRSEELRRTNTAIDIPHLLSYTPSFVATSESGTGIGYTGLRIRGTDGNRINVTIDGIPLNDSESQQVFWVNIPDLASSVENIQIQRGVGTSSNGAGAFGATINMQIANASDKPFAEVSSSAGSFNTFKNVVSAGTGLINDKFAFQMRYSDIESDGYILRTGSKHKSWFMTGTYSTGKSSLKANIILGEERTGIGWTGVPKDSLATNRRYNPAGAYRDANGVLQHYENETDNYRQNHYHLIYNRRFADSWMLNTALHYTKGEGYFEEYRENRRFSDHGLPPVQVGDLSIARTDMIRRRWLSNDFYGAVFSVNYRKNRLEAIVGGGANQYLGDHFGRIIWMRNPGLTQRDFQWYFNDSQKSEANLYGKVNYLLTSKTSIFGDLQYRIIDYKMQGIDSDANLTDLTQSHKYNFFNPKAGIFHSISTNQNLWLSFAVANREPSRNDFRAAAGDLNATPKPETLYNIELGYRIRNQNSLASVNLYGMFYDDQLVPTGKLSETGRSIMTNVEKSYRVGVEISGGLKLFNRLDWNANMTLSQNKILDYVEHYRDYNTNDWSFEDKSKELGTVDIAYSPSVIFNNSFSLNIVKNLNLSLVSKYVGKQYFDNTMNDERSINQYFVSNMQIAFAPKIKYTENVEFQFMINNIFNKKYESNAYGWTEYENGVESTHAFYFPQAGTNFMSRIVVRF